MLLIGCEYVCLHNEAWQGKVTPLSHMAGKWWNEYINSSLLPLKTTNSPVKYVPYHLTSTVSYSSTPNMWVVQIVCKRQSQLPPWGHPEVETKWPGKNHCTCHGIFTDKSPSLTHESDPARPRCLSSGQGWAENHSLEFTPSPCAHSETRGLFRNEVRLCWVSCVWMN